MLIYLFASDDWPSVQGFTSDQTGGNLPAEYRPWRPVNLGRAIPVEKAATSIGDSIAQEGFFLLSGAVQYSRQRTDKPAASPRPAPEPALRGLQDGSPISGMTQPVR